MGGAVSDLGAAPLAAVNDYIEIIVAKSCKDARTKAVVKYGTKRFIKKVEIKK